MRWMHWLPGAVLFTAPLALAQTPAAASPRSFTANLVTIFKGGKESSTRQRIAVRGDMMHFRSGDEPMGILLDFGQEKVWMLIPQEKMAIESKLTRSLNFPLSLVLTDASGNPCGKEPTLTCTREGEEPISGRPTVKWRIVHTSKDKKTRTETAWVDPKLGTVVRHATEDGGAMELRDLQEGPVEEALVQFPAGFVTVDEKNLRHEDEPKPAPKPKKKDTAPGKKP
ncbi:hypothetical protein [Archangium lansingense]|uniref:DUF4412 domain-containing protein n=1 Tax=Archangium lansingense TaxID=2995310 RepID=A0ABT4ADC5_9BACT|nr:hypothetical protein [Archangium lansinium]MCY1078909.1 hypothetical protein [Archangium lansinium]